jgi:hypothetical protein
LGYARSALATFQHVQLSRGAFLTLRLRRYENKLSEWKREQHEEKEKHNAIAQAVMRGAPVALAEAQYDALMAGQKPPMSKDEAQIAVPGHPGHI